MASSVIIFQLTFYEWREFKIFRESDYTITIIGFLYKNYASYKKYLQNHFSLLILFINIMHTTCYSVKNCFMNVILKQKIMTFS